MRLLLLVGALGIAAPASALDLSGGVGVFYDRTDARIGDTSTTSPRLQLDGLLRADGALFEPDLGRWRGEVGYQRLQRTFVGSEDKSGILTYSGYMKLFDSPVAPLSLTLWADRAQTDSTVDVGDQRTAGTRIESAYIGRLELNNKVLPSLSVGGGFRETISDGFAAARTTDAARLLDVATHQGGDGYDARASYQGRWNEGSLDLLDFTSHYVDFAASAQPQGGVSGYMNGRFQLRVPTSPTSGPRVEETSVATGANIQDGTSYTLLGYGYDHALLQSDVTGDQERIRHSVFGTRTIVHSATWDSRWRTSLAVGQDRAAARETSAYGASLGSVLRWRRLGADRELILEGGPTVGVLDPQDGGAKLGAGATWQGQIAWTAPARYALTYGGDYGRNLDATDGWRLDQNVMGDLETTLGTTRARAALTLSSARHHDALFGDGASRSVVFTCRAWWTRSSVQLDAGLRDGTSPSVSARGDALFIPSAFDSHTRSAALYGTTALTRSLDLYGRARYSKLSGPDVLPQQEYALAGGLEYAIGQLRLSLEERYTAGGTSSFDRRVNEVFVRLFRTFGTRL